MKKEAGQAALEYLLSYGWAIILITAIVSILAILVFTPAGYACSGFSGMLCGSVKAEGQDIFVVVINGNPRDITISPFTGIKTDGHAGYAIIIYKGKEYKFKEVAIKKGETFELKAEGVGTAKQIEITYTETETGYEKTALIHISGPVKEICNNGIPDTGAGLTDCRNPECTDCTYVLETESEWPVAVPPPQSFLFVFDAPIADLGQGTWKITAEQVAFYQPIDPRALVLAVCISCDNPPCTLESGTSYRGVLPKQDIEQGWNIIEVGTRLSPRFEEAGPESIANKLLNYLQVNLYPPQTFPVSEFKPRLIVKLAPVSPTLP